MKGVDANSLLLPIITDMPDSKIANLFFIDMGNLVTLEKKLNQDMKYCLGFSINSKTIC